MRMPEGWNRIRLGDLGTWRGGGTPSKANPEYWQGNIPWVSPKDMRGPEVWDTEDHISEDAIAGSATNLMPEGSVLLVTRSGILRHTLPIAVAKVAVAINQDIKALQTGPMATGQFAAQLLRWQEKSLLDRCAKVGTTVESIDYSALLAFEVWLPPLPEQKKIAAILSSVDEAIEATQAVVEQLQVVKKAMMGELLTKGIPGRHSRFKKTEIGEVPEGWGVVSIDVLGPRGESTVRTGPFGSSMKSKDFRESGVPVLTIQSLGQGEVLRKGLFFVDETKASELAAYKVRPNDLVFSRVADIGRCIAIGIQEAGWLISPNLSRIRLDPEKVSARFLMYLLTMADSVLRQLESVAGYQGRPVISSSTLKALRLPLPAIEEQKEIASIGEALEARIAVEAHALRGLRHVKSALLSVLLTGEVRVRVEEEEARCGA